MDLDTDLKIELRATGGIDNLVAAPAEAQPPGQGEIRIRQAAAGVNFIDVYQRQGLYSLPLPAVLGVEGPGVVEAVGPGVEGLREGDRVAYGGLVGGYAATRLLPAWRAVHLPDGIDFNLAAASFLRGMTAHMLLAGTYAVRPGMTLLVHAAAGGLGMTLTRWAKQRGCTVIGTVSSPEKAALAREQGADHLIVGREADVVAEVARLTNGQGVDYAIDGLGGDVLPRTFACMRSFGMVASIGQAAGPIAPVPVQLLSARSLSLARPSIMAFAADPGRYRQAAGAVVEAIGLGLMPAPRHVFALKEAGMAQQALESGKTTGSIVLVP